MTTSSKPLAGLKVLDFGHTIMGPCAGVVFADLGADVVKIEPVDGDPTRRLPGFAAGFFATYNRNKRSIAIDLKRPEGQAIVHRLVRDADVVLENFGPGTIERLKCSWEDLRQINPRLVYLSMKGFLKGPYENRGALDEVVQMQSGLAYMTGPPGRPLRANARIGHRHPAHSTSLGKAMMAFLPDADALALRIDLPQRTINTLTDADKLRRQVDDVRRRGYAIEVGENEDGLMCIGVPILDEAGRPVAAMSLSAPERRMKPELTIVAADALTGAAKRMSTHLSAQH